MSDLPFYIEAVVFQCFCIAALSVAIVQLLSFAHREPRYIHPDDSGVFMHSFPAIVQVLLCLAKCIQLMAGTAYRSQLGWRLSYEFLTTNCSLVTVLALIRFIAVVLENAYRAQGLEFSVMQHKIAVYSVPVVAVTAAPPIEICSIVMRAITNKEHWQVFSLSAFCIVVVMAFTGMWIFTWQLTHFAGLMDSNVGGKTTFSLCGRLRKLYVLTTGVTVLGAVQFISNAYFISQIILEDGPFLKPAGSSDEDIVYHVALLLGGCLAQFFVWVPYEQTKFYARHHRVVSNSRRSGTRKRSKNTPASPLVLSSRQQRSVKNTRSSSLDQLPSSPVCEHPSAVPQEVQCSDVICAGRLSARGTPDMTARGGGTRRGGAGDDGDRESSESFSQVSNSVNEKRTTASTGTGSSISTSTSTAILNIANVNCMSVKEGGSLGNHYRRWSVSSTASHRGGGGSAAFGDSPRGDNRGSLKNLHSFGVSHDQEAHETRASGGGSALFSVPPAHGCSQSLAAVHPAPLSSVPYSFDAASCASVCATTPRADSVPAVSSSSSSSCSLPALSGVTVSCASSSGTHTDAILSSSSAH